MKLKNDTHLQNLVNNICKIHIIKSNLTIWPLNIGVWHFGQSVFNNKYHT